MKVAKRDVKRLAAAYDRAFTWVSAKGIDCFDLVLYDYRRISVAASLYVYQYGFMVYRHDSDEVIDFISVKL